MEPKPKEKLVLFQVWGSDIFYIRNKIILSLKNLLEKRIIECENHVFK